MLRSTTDLEDYAIGASDGKIARLPGGADAENLVQLFFAIHQRAIVRIRWHLDRIDAQKAGLPTRCDAQLIQHASRDALAGFRPVPQQTIQRASDYGQDQHGLPTQGTGAREHFKPGHARQRIERDAV